VVYGPWLKLDGDRYYHRYASAENAAVFDVAPISSLQRA
jgi:hypothetical protein